MGDTSRKEANPATLTSGRPCYPLLHSDYPDRRPLRTSDRSSASTSHTPCRVQCLYREHHVQ